MYNTMGDNEAGEGSTRKKRLEKKSKVWAPRKKRLPKRSEVWDDHLAEIYTNEGRKAHCKYCKKNLSLTSSTTTHLRRHLTDIHGIQFPNKERIARPSTIAENNKRVATDRLPTTTFRDDIDMMHLGRTRPREPPTSALGDEARKFGLNQAPPKIAFQDEVKNICSNREMSGEIQVNANLAAFLFGPPNIRIASGHLMVMSMEKDICEHYQRVKHKLVTEFGSLTARVSFSIKFMEAGWISITAHFIDSDFNLVKKLIGFRKLPTDVSSNLGEATDIIDSCISDWKLENKIFSFTTERWHDLYLSFDEKFASKMLVGCYEMRTSCLQKTVGEWYYNHLLGCDAEDEMLVMFDDYFLRDDGKKNKITKFVEGVLENYYRRQTFNEIAKEKGLPPINEDWLKGQPIGWYAGTDCWKFCRPVVKLFKNALLYKEVFAKCALVKIGESPFSKIDLQDIDWSKLKDAVEHFEAINPIINLLSNFKYPTQHLRFQSGIKIRHLMNPCYEENDYDPYIWECPCITYVACVLDPRYKLAFLKYFFKKLSPSEWNDMVDEIYEFLKKLFGEYLEKESYRVSHVSLRSTNKHYLAIINKFSLHIKELKTSRRKEMKQYLTEETVAIRDTHFDLLGWWKENRSRYPVLSRMARDVLAIPACVYCVEENLNLDLTDLQGVSPELVETVICSKDWILSDLLSSPEVFQRRNNQQPSASATANDSGEKTVNANNAQHNSAVEIPCGTSPTSPSPTNISEEIRGISENNKETLQPPSIGNIDEVTNFGLTREIIWEILVNNAILADFPFLSPNVKKAWSHLKVMDMEKEICKYYQGVKEKLVTEFGNLTSQVSISIKIMEDAEWISITAHFINSDFNLVKKLIGFKKIPDVSSNLCNATDIVDSCISDWKLENKIFSFTTERVNLYVSLKEKFGPKMLFDLDDLPSTCFREAVGSQYCSDLKFWLSDGMNKIIKLFEDVLRGDHLVLKNFNIIAREKGLHPITEDWLKDQPIEWYTETDYWKFCGSVVKMFKDALLYEEAFAQCGIEQIEGHSISESDLQRFDWQQIEEAIDCFEAINSIIDQLSNFRYPTSTVRFQSEIIQHILDPRYKLAFLKYFLKEEKYWDYDNNCNCVVDGIRVFLKKMFSVYLKEETNQVSPASPESVNTEESSSKSSTSDNPSTIMDNFSLYIQESKTSRRKEMKQYLAEETVDIGDTHFDVLGWWKHNRSRYPVLSKMARDVLAIPACAYSVEENLKLDLAVLQRVNPELVEAAVCSKEWILSDVQSPQQNSQWRNDRQSSVLAAANDNIHINSHNYGEKTVNAINAQHGSAVEIPRGTSPISQHLNKVYKEMINISESNQEIPRPQPTLHKQFNGNNATYEDVEITKAAIHQSREKIQGKKVHYDICGLGLTREEILAVELLEQINPTEMIVNIEADPDNPISLTREGVNSLVLPFSKDGEPRWLVDDVIDAYISIINHGRDPSRKVIIVSSFNTQLLCTGLMCKTEWKMRKLGTQFLENDLIFFPINNNGVHWIVGALNFTKHEFQILDSKVMDYNFGSQNPYNSLTYELFSGIEKCIQSVLASNESMKGKSKLFDGAKRNVNIIKTVPQQTDGSSCGLFALRYMQFWDGSNFSRDVSFSQDDMEIFRKKIVAELIMSELNLVKAIPREIRRLLN